MYVVLNINNRPVKGPSAWTNSMQEYCGLVGNKGAPKLPYTLPNGQKLVGVDKRGPNEILKYQKAVKSNEFFDGTNWVIEYEGQEIPTDQAKSIAWGELASIRYNAEVGGIQFDTGNGFMMVDTQRDTQNILMGASIKAKEDASRVVVWKLGNGVHANLDASTTIAVSDAVFNHVEACFANEAVISEKIFNANSNTALRLIDLTEGF